MKNLILSILLVFSSVGCAVAPFMEGTTARSLRKGEVEVVEQFTTLKGEQGVDVVPVGQINYGVSNDLDLSFRTEFQSFGVSAKYSIINNPYSGYSLAPTLGVVYLASDISYQLGLIHSYKWKHFETYMSVRYNMVNFDPAKVDKNFFNNAPGLNFNFISHTYGFRYIVNKSISLGPEVIVIESPDDGTEFKNDVLVGFQIQIKP